MFEVSIGLGVILSLFFLETFGVAAGGIIVAGYIAYYIHQPVTILATLSISFLVYFIVFALSKVMFLYGRRRMVIAVLLGFIFAWGSRELNVFANLPFDYSVTVIGFIIPGLIANSFQKQGVIRTLGVMILAAVVVRLILILVFEGKMI